MEQEHPKDENSTSEASHLQRVSIGDFSAILGLSAILIAYVILGIGVEYIPVFIDLPSLAIVLGIVVGGLLFGHGSRKSCQAIWHSIKGHVSSEAEAVLAEDVLSLGIRLSILAGAVGTLIGFILGVCMGFDHPRELIMGLVLALLSQFYAVTLAVGFTMGRSRAIRALVRMREAAGAGDMARPLVCPRSVWLLILAPLATLLIVGMIQHVLLLQTDDSYRLIINNDTAAEWMYSGHLVVIDIANQKQADTVEFWPDRLWSYDEESKNLNRWLGQEVGLTRTPSKVFLVLVDKTGFHKMTIEKDWPSGTKQLKVKVSNHVDKSTISVITARMPFQSVPSIPSAPPYFSHREKSKFDPKKLRAIKLPDSPTKDQVRDYIDDLLAASKEHDTTGNEDEPEVEMLEKVGVENVHLLLDALSFHDGRSHHRLQKAIDALATDAHKNLILQKLPKQKQLVVVVVSHGWAQDAKGILLSELKKRERFIDWNWLEAVANLRDPKTYDDLKWHFINGMNPHLTYKCIRDLPGIGIEPAIGKFWDRAKVEGGWDSMTAAKIAAPFGYKDALERLFSVLASPNRDRRDMSGVRATIHKSTGITGEDMQLVKWYGENKNKLRFDSKAKKYVVKE